MKIIIHIPFKTPSVNNLYCPVNGRMILKKEARIIKEEIKELIDNIPLKQRTIFSETDKLRLTVRVHENWLTKKGTIFKKDVMNRTKFLIDSVFKNLPNIDDCQIYEQSIIKVQDEEKEFSIIEIEVLKDGTR